MTRLLEKFGCFLLNLHLKRQIKDHEGHDHGKAPEPKVDQKPKGRGKIPKNQEDPAGQHGEANDKSHAFFKAYPKSHVRELAFKERLACRLKDGKEITTFIEIRSQEKTFRGWIFLGGLHGGHGNLDKARLIQNETRDLASGHARPIGRRFIFPEHPLTVKDKKQRDDDRPDEEKPMDRIHGF